MTFVLWFLFACSVLLAGYGYAGWRLISPAHIPQPWSAVAWMVVVALAVFPVVAMYLTVNRINAPWRTLLEWVAYLSLGFFSITLTMLLLRDAVWLLVVGGQKIAAVFNVIRDATIHPGAPVSPERRQVLVQSMNIGILGMAVALTGYGFFEARRRPAIVEVSVPIDDLPESLQGFRIVQISDLHAGLTVARPFVETVVGMANDLKGDIVAFTGDLVDGSVEHLREHVAPMANLSARYGRYFITGNHEYYSGAGPWVEEAKRLGFDVLINEHRVIRHGEGTILLAGVTDSSAGQFLRDHASDPHKAITGAPDADVRILLAHQPRSLYEAVKAGYDLQISGHTHGGQFFPWNYVAAAGQPYIKGLHKHGTTWIYVSKGTGYWGPPVRLGARSEITVITLTAPGAGQSPA